MPLLFAPLNAVIALAAIACAAFNLAARLWFRHWSVSSSAQPGRKLRRHLPGLHGHLWSDYLPLFGGPYVTFT